MLTPTYLWFPLGKRQAGYQIVFAECAKSTPHHLALGIGTRRIYRLNSQHELARDAP